MPLLRSRRLVMALCLILAFGCAQASQAQTISAPENAVSPLLPGGGVALDLPASETIRKRVDEVNVVFTVTTTRGRFVSSLSLDDLKVLDNRLPPERISYFRQQSDMPLRVALLVDLSDSIVNRFEYEKKAAAMFLKEVLRPQVDEAFLVGFGSDVSLLQDSTGDINKLSRAIRAMKAGGNTRLYDAIQFASGKLRRGAQPGAGRRAIVIISDGVDTYSSAALREAGQAAVRAQATLYALSTNSRSDVHGKGETALHLLVGPTGGQVLPADTRKRMMRAFSLVNEALHSQYVVAYKPADFKPDGGFRTIKIVPRNRHLLVNCRHGYFAPSEEDAAWYAAAP
jgi:VWFA-related protein